jgi:DNA polymerase-3 subunit gamma/tau
MGIEAEDEALFWIARESTGSLRDAYTLFDQVVSFSDGHIRSALIREKMGLVGLETLNGFAESCAANDFPGVLSRIDEILAAGVAVETFITNLAAYYHNLLLIKAGVNRESVLGYSPDRFSSQVLEKLDTPRLAHAGELLFGLYRDISYSVSPRFELETLASKLCWLDRWVSPPELAETVERAKEALKGGVSRPLAGAAAAWDSPQEAAAPANPAASASFRREEKEPGFLTEGFKRYIESKKSGGFNGADRPWDDSPPRNSPDLNPGVQTVLKLFQGTIVTKT